MWRSTPKRLSCTSPTLLSLSLFILYFYTLRLLYEIIIYFVRSSAETFLPPKGKRTKLHYLCTIHSFPELLYIKKGCKFAEILDLALAD
ncbi:hypothetical protein D910_06649 [Dendroctonus ponderosae]|uniref:Uncharacterized protein n=1 Tax=Dendroctonus ponderosae TaxID=77166 RepID=U4UFB1_DENPD|nr:hypothetical protein D910_06649 [Dendroctonus ponderosae]